MKVNDIITLLLTISLMSSCSKEPSQQGGFEGEEKYDYFLLSALGSWPNTVHYMTATNNLREGEMNLEVEGDEVNSKGTYSYIVKDGYIYNYKTDQGVFKKMKYTKDHLVTELEVPFAAIYDINTFTWIDDNTLLVLGTTGGVEKLVCTVFDVRTLRILHQGEIKGLDTFPDKYNYYLLGAIAYVDGKLFLQYGYRDHTWLTPSYFNFATISYPNFEVISKEDDTRSRGVANSSPYFRTTFVKDKTDFYFTCFPREATGQTDVFLFRARKGDTATDKSYEINLSNLVGGKTIEPAIGYLGDNKMVLLYRDPALGDRYNARYALVDLETKKIVRVLDEIPGDEPYELGFFCKEGKLYIANNAAKEQNHIWIYDSQTDQVTKGMKIPDRISGFARFESFY